MMRRSLKRFQEKCAAVFRPEPRQNKRIEPFRDSKKREKGLGLFAAAGLFAGAAAWAVHQQAGVILASWSCTEAPSAIKSSGIAAVVVLLIGAMLSAIALQRMRGSPDDGAPRRFLADIGLMGAALFFFAVFLQVCASFFLPGCAG
jgi:hypothetical protein